MRDQATPGKHTHRMQRSECLVLLVSLLLYATMITHGLPNRDAVWMFDANPLMPLIAFKRVFLDGWNTGFHSAYPDFHYWVLCLVLLPYMGLQYLLGNLDGLNMSIGYPYGLDNYDTIFMHLAILTRLVSIAMGLGMIYFVMRISRALFPSLAAGFAGLIAGLSPAVTYYVHGETLDVPMLFWLSAAMLAYVRALQTLQLRYYIWLAILAAVSTATKDYAYAAFVLLPFPLVWQLATHGSSRISWYALLRAALDRRHTIALAVFLLSFVLAENILWNPSGFLAHVKLAAGHPDAVHGSQGPITTDFSRLHLLSWKRLPQIGYTMPFALGWISFPVSVAGLLMLFAMHRKHAAWLAVPIAGYYIFTVIPVLGPSSAIERPFLGIALLLSIPGGFLLGTLWKTTSHQLASRLFAGLLVILIFANSLLVTLSLATDSRYRVEQWITDNADNTTEITFLGWRSLAPRSVLTHNIQVVNERDFPDNADVHVGSTQDVDRVLRETNPEVVVISDQFSNQFTRWSTSSPALAGPTISPRTVPDLLEKLGYRPVAKFSPWFGPLFGMPKYRRYIPTLQVYERIASNHTSHQQNVNDQ